MVLGVDRRNPTDYTGPQVNLIPVMEARREPTILDTAYPLAQIWRVGKDPTTGDEGDYWILSYFDDGDAVWVKWAPGSASGLMTLSDTADTEVSPDGGGNIQLEGSTGIDVTSSPGSNLLTFSLVGGGVAIQGVVVDEDTAPGSDPVIADGSGNITVTGAQIANANLMNAIRTNSLAANTSTREIQQADSAAAEDVAQNGIAHFNSAQFTVSNGFVSAVGSPVAPPLVNIDVDANTGPGTDPVVPDALATIAITGAQIANASLTNAIRTNSLAANAFTIQIQRAGSHATGAANQNGICHFDSDQFTVTDGFVQLPGGGGPAATVFNTDSVGNVTPVLGEVKVYGQSGSVGATSGIQVTTDAGDTMLVRMLTPYSLGDFSFQSTTSGATRTLTVENTSDTASSQATQNIKVAGTSAGDAWTQYTVGTTRSFSIGIDNSDASDSLKFTTDADGTVDPSSGTFLGAINPSTGGLEWGANSLATTSTNVIGSFRKDQNTGTLVTCVNNTAGTGASAGFQADSNGGDAFLIASINGSYTVDAGLAGCTYFHAIGSNAQYNQVDARKWYWIGSSTVDVICALERTGGLQRFKLVNGNGGAGESAQITVQQSDPTSDDAWFHAGILGGNEWSAGIDNSDSDSWKFTTGANPSTGTAVFTLTQAGAILTNSSIGTTAGGGQGARIRNDTNYALERDVSSIRYKDNVKPLYSGIDAVMKMQPCTYTSRCVSDDPKQVYVGFIAEEMCDVVPEAVVMYDGKPDGIAYERLTAVLCKAIQELKQEIDQLKAGRNATS
jgi:hypothetical protein